MEISSSSSLDLAAVSFRFDVSPTGGFTRAALLAHRTLRGVSPLVLERLLAPLDALRQTKSRDVPVARLGTLGFTPDGYSGRQVRQKDARRDLVDVLSPMPARSDELLAQVLFANSGPGQPGGDGVQWNRHGPMMRNPRQARCLVAREPIRLLAVLPVSWARASVPVEYLESEDTARRYFGKADDTSNMGLVPAVRSPEAKRRLQEALAALPYGSRVLLVDFDTAGRFTSLDTAVRASNLADASARSRISWPRRRKRLSLKEKTDFPGTEVGPYRFIGCLVTLFKFWNRNCPKRRVS